MQRVIHTMRHDAIAIALYLYLATATTIQVFRILPLPPALEAQSPFVITITTGSVWLGCLICACSRILIKDELDSGAVEQLGLIVANVGWLLYIYAFAQRLPMAVFTLTVCGGFLVAFSVQWWLIRRWRSRLRALAGTDGE